MAAEFLLLNTGDRLLLADGVSRLELNTVTAPIPWRTVDGSSSTSGSFEGSGSAVNQIGGTGP